LSSFEFLIGHELFPIKEEGKGVTKDPFSWWVLMGRGGEGRERKGSQIPFSIIYCSPQIGVFSRGGKW